MALMIPENVEQFTTEGEKQFYRFLEAVAKPDSRHIAWYTPDINGNEPDFLLFSNHSGIVVFEVKDWVLDQILRLVLTKKPKGVKIPISKHAIISTI